MKKSFGIHLLACVLAASLFSCTRELPTVPVTGVELSPESLEIEVGEQAVVTATVLPQNASNRAVVFSSSRESVATVSQDGIVEGVSAGSAIITITTEEGNFKAHCSVTVLEDINAGTGTVSNISCRNAVISGTAKLPKEGSEGLSFGIMYSANLEFPEASTVRIAAESTDADNNFSIVTETLEPETTYYYRGFVSEGGETVLGEVKSFKTLPLSSMIQTLDPSELTFNGCKLNASLILTDCIYKELEYGFELSIDGKFAYAKASDNLAEGQFSQAAVLEAEHEYSCLAYVKLDGRTYKAEAKSFKAPATPVSGVSVSPESVKIKIGGKSALSVVVSPQNAGNKAVVFSSDNESVATVSTEGEITGVSAGTATVTVTTVDGNFKAHCSVTVLENINAGTGTVSNISCCNAVISGTAKLPEGPEGLSFGIMYSANMEFPEASTVRIAAESVNESNNFSVVTETLEPETTYYYRGFVSEGGETVLGEVKSFKTLAVSSLVKTLEPVIQNTKSSLLKGEFDLTDCVYKIVEKGFEFTQNGIKLTLNATDYSDKGINGLIKYYASTFPGQEHSYRAYVKLDGRTYWGETVKLTAPAIQASVILDDMDSESQTYCNAFVTGRVSIADINLYDISCTLYYSSTATTLNALRSSGTAFPLERPVFAVYLEDLPSATTYHYAVVAKVDDAEFVSEVKSFATKPITGSVTAGASGISFDSATVSGNASADSPSIITLPRSAVLYYSSTASTVNALKSSGTAKTLTLNSEGNYTVSLLSLNQNTKYYYTVVLTAYDKEFNSGVKSFTTKQLLVDLGLSVNWASFNLGASAPEGYGGYYMWGGTKDVSDTNINLAWDTCPFHEGNTDPGSGWLKYNVNGVPSTTLLPEHDAAHVALGGNWRIPTIGEWEELRKNCTWTDTSLNGVAGYKVQSNISGYTDNWIFLPKAGKRDGTTLSGKGSDGIYWSSNYNQKSPKQACSYYLSGTYIGYTYRYIGLPIRPVISK